jgi:hypothetical protein
MQKLKLFFWRCSGADLSLLEKCPSESSKYAGIGATIFFTGVFAALSGAYAIQTVFDNILVAITFGVIWGLMIFNLDRYIVSSMRKEGKFLREMLTAMPRVILAVLISIVIAKPLELKIFEKEIQPELIVMKQQALARQELELKGRFTQDQQQTREEISLLKKELEAKAAKRDELVRAAQEEADGTGGSMKKNLGPIYMIKKADADQAEKELYELEIRNRLQIKTLESSLRATDSAMNTQLAGMEQPLLTGLAARLEALHRITQQSNAIWWANLFIMLLFVVVETAPVIVKLISAKGPYDNLLFIEEHRFEVEEVELLVKTNADAKERTLNLPQQERDYLANRLDAGLP